MIKLQDFAKRHGVTDRAIQKHLKTYALELEGLFERKGPNGTWLTDEACDILLSKMKQPPTPVIFDEDPRVKELKEDNKQLLQALNVAKDKIIELTEQNGQLALKADKVELLEADNQAKKQEKELLEGFIKDAKAEIEVQKAEKANLSADIKNKDKILEEKENELKKANTELTEAKEQIEKMKHATFWQRLRGFKE